MKSTSITINTDASYCPKTGAAGYAFWIVCDLFTIKKSGMFKTTAKDPTDAESKCIANAIATLLAQKELPTVKWIIVNTDSLHSMERIQSKNTRKTSGFYNQIYAQWQTLKKRMKSEKAEFRHVKAHSGVKDKRSYVNEWCDENAKREMYKMRQILNTKFKGLRIGEIVSHDDYSSEKFTVQEINIDNGCVTTKGGKNGTWVNNIDLIVRFGK